MGRHSAPCTAAATAAAALAIAVSQRKKVISKIREAKKPNTPIEDKLDLLGDAIVYLAGAMTAVGAGAYRTEQYLMTVERFHLICNLCENDIIEINVDLVVSERHLVQKFTFLGAIHMFMFNYNVFWITFSKV